MTIRRTPQDFVVEEQLEAGFVGAGGAGAPGAHAVYELSKTSMTTPEAVQRFAKAVGVRGGRVDYAGLKDKHAHTVQHVSVAAEVFRAGAPPEASGQGWSARLLGWAAAPLQASAIRANRFTIVVRGLAKETCAEMDRRARSLADGDGLLFVNYFGDQRFGSARHGKGFVASRVVKGDYEGALRLAIATPARKDAGKTRTFTRMAAQRWGDWEGLARDLPRCPERRAIETLASGGTFRDAFSALPPFLQAMYLEAHQSLLWNATARRLAWRIAEEAGGAPLRSDDTFGEMVFPAAAAVGEAWRELDVPLLAKSTDLREPWAEAAREALAEEGLELGELRAPGLRRPFYGEAPRRLFARASAFEAGPAEPDELGGRLKRRLVFELPRGSYATVALRALGQ